MINHMTTLTQSITRSRRLTLLGIVGFAAALAAASQVAVPIPGTPVPFTLQPLVVVLAGLMLGPVAGAASMLIYLAAGAVGLPVFSPIGNPGVARLFGPTGGYLIAYPVAAFTAGKLAGAQSTLQRRFLAACAGIALIFVGGIAQLSLLNGSLSQAIRLGVRPFALLDVVKAFIAALASAPRSRKDV